jgi:hypothetical protein
MVPPYHNCTEIPIYVCYETNDTTNVSRSTTTASYRRKLSKGGSIIYLTCVPKQTILILHVSSKQRSKHND